MHIDNEWVKKWVERDLFLPHSTITFLHQISTKKCRMSAKIRDLLWLINCALTVCLLPLWFQVDECTCAPSRDSLFGYALRGDPLALSGERWSQAAWSGSPESLKGGVQGGLVELRVWGSVAGKRWFVKQICARWRQVLIQRGHICTIHFVQLVTQHCLFNMA